MRAAELCMHTAPWVVPVSRPPIAGGGVVVAAGRIVAVDEAEALSQRFPGIPVEDTRIAPSPRRSSTPTPTWNSPTWPD